MITLPSQPIAPKIFFGRGQLISEIASLIVHNEQTRLAILGAGGMGKTSVALHVLHHQDVVTRYGSHRHFVACDAVTSHNALAELILQVLQVTADAKENVVTERHVLNPSLLCDVRYGAHSIDPTGEFVRRTD